jgi:hypothetical protein
MRKLKLSVDALQVESFHAEAPQPNRGTVAGHTGPEECVSPYGSCERWCTDGTCNNTCPASCFGTCGTCGNSCNGTCDFFTCGGCSTRDTECNCQTFETCPGAPICT